MQFDSNQCLAVEGRMGSKGDAAPDERGLRGDAGVRSRAAAVATVLRDSDDVSEVEGIAIGCAALDIRFQQQPYAGDGLLQQGGRIYRLHE